MPPRHLDGLNERQIQAATTVEGPLLVLAGAGTGKTRVVTSRIAHLIDRGVPADAILAVTFTNKAAREMRQRVARTVSGSATEGLVVSTFHSFAIRLLRRFGERLGYRKTFTIADEDDVATLVRSALRELGVAESVVSVKTALWLIGGWKNRGFGPDAALEIAVDDAEILTANAYRKLAREMADRQVVDFDDMILLSNRLFREHPDALRECQDRFRFLMVDEYQDTNGSQYELIRELSGERRNLCVVGDDDQSIYGWRGARAGNILDFTRHYPGAKVVALEQNYRSTNVILRAANSVIGNNPNRREKKLWSALGEGELIDVYKADDEREEIRWIVSGLAEAVSAGARHDDLAVLFRANAQSNPLEPALRERKIPYRIVGTNSLFDRREIRDVVAYLKIACNPRDDGAFMRVVNTPPRGIGKTTQARLLEHAVERRTGMFDLVRDGIAETLEPKAAAALRELRDTMATVVTQAESAVRPALETLLEKIAYRAFLAMEYADPVDAQVRGNALDELLRAAGSFDRQAQGSAGGLAPFLESLALDRDQPDEDDDTSRQGVTLMTVHAAKGLEFERVWLMGVEEGIFPHKRSFESDEGSDTIDEERRLFYVAVTRARRRLSMSRAVQRTRWGKTEPRLASRFIAEMDESVLNHVDAEKMGPATESAAGDYFGRLWAKVGKPADDDLRRPR